MSRLERNWQYAEQYPNETDAQVQAELTIKYAGYLEDPEDLKSVNKAKNGLVRAGYDYDDINKAIKDFLEK